MSEEWIHDEFMYAVACGDLDELKRLLSNKEVIKRLVRWNECTPLRVAAAHGHLKVVKLLVEKGASVTAQNNRTIIRAASKGATSRCIVARGEKG